MFVATHDVIRVALDSTFENAVIVRIVRNDHEVWTHANNVA